MTRRLERLARSNILLLFAGETGTGKEHHARLVHAMSERRGPFLKINLRRCRTRFDETISGRGHLWTRTQRDAVPRRDRRPGSSPAGQAQHRLDQHPRLERRTGLPARIVSATHRDLQVGLLPRVPGGPLLQDPGYLARIPPAGSQRGSASSAGPPQERGDPRPGPAGHSRVPTAAAALLALQHSELRQTLTTAVVLSSAGGSITMDMVEEI